VIDLTVRQTGRRNDLDMRIQRLSLPVHGTIELLTGLVLIGAPFVLSFHPAAFVVSLALGGMLTGASLGLTTQTATSVASHSHFDNLFVLAAALGALWLAFSSQPIAAVLLVAVVAVQAALGLTTRYARVD
jgi:hypothetical protein